MPVPEHLISELRAAAAAAVKTETAIADTRAAMVEAAAQLHSLIEQLPVGDVASLGLRVEIVARGTPLVSAPSEGLRIKTLPSLPEGDFDVRPGATALYL